MAAFDEKIQSWPAALPIDPLRMSRALGNAVKGGGGAECSVAIYTEEAHLDIVAMALETDKAALTHLRGDSNLQQLACRAMRHLCGSSMADPMTNSDGALAVFEGWIAMPKTQELLHPQSGAAASPQHPAPQAAAEAAAPTATEQPVSAAAVLLAPAAASAPAPAAPATAVAPLPTAALPLVAGGDVQAALAAIPEGERFIAMMQRHNGPLEDFGGWVVSYKGARAYAFVDGMYDWGALPQLPPPGYQLVGVMQYGVSAPAASAPEGHSPKQQPQGGDSVAELS